MTLTRILAALPGRAASPAPGGPAGRYLTSPGAFTARLARLLLAILEHLRPGGRPAAGRRRGRRRWRAGRGCAAASTPPSPPLPAPSRSWPRRRPTRAAPRRCGGT